ncbi:hypothetical protein MTR67_018547 [Solanum verrucosum]|uniref:Uncharacterized protein n=1 Tax=Solanum verrucosum TaxID=315347 RepID=A0AAF0TLP0_SOLVR|nr:hypothetical protein MTR67_018547 [Solanum verrucosum]
MASSSKLPRETIISESFDISLAIGSKESPPDFIWVSMDGISHIISINGLPPLPADEEVYSQDLSLVLLPDASSEGEASVHASFRSPPRAVVMMMGRGWVRHPGLADPTQVKDHIGLNGPWFSTWSMVWLVEDTS